MTRDWTDERFLHSIGVTMADSAENPHAECHRRWLQERDARCLAEESVVAERAARRLVEESIVANAAAYKVLAAAHEQDLQSWRASAIWAWAGLVLAVVAFVWLWAQGGA